MKPFRISHVSHVQALIQTKSSMGRAPTPLPPLLFFFFSFSPHPSRPPSHRSPHETVQAEGPQSHDAYTSMKRHQHYPVAESHAIYSLPIKIKHQFSCESFDKVMTEHLGSIVTGGSHGIHVST
ncbi:hypothetical protein VN97_g10588 [Penicillium thymicola]|uniref:Uncharacterized protein n=1 Tax=Penicillium thymicola TaxID=293382 RepID=A0AAI9X3P3_PENTH|nr:hypothetical protein VN97_g10588 [Penicillium thymicola]